MMRLADLRRTYSLSDTETRSLIFAPLAAKFVRDESRACVADILATNLDTMHPLEVSAFYRALRLPEAACQKDAIASLQSAARTSPDLAALLVEILTSTVGVHDARAALLLDAEVNNERASRARVACILPIDRSAGATALHRRRPTLAQELPGDGGIARISDVQEACLKRYGSASGLWREMDLRYEAGRLAKELASVCISGGCTSYTYVS